MAKNNLTYWYHLIAIITVIIWGTTFVSTKILIHNGLSPVDILFYRFALAYVCIWFISPKVLFARSKRDELMFVAAGLCGDRSILLPKIRRWGSRWLQTCRSSSAPLLS